MDVELLPPELTAVPLNFIIFSGLNTINNENHSSIWNAFSSNRRPDRLPLHFELINAASDFPKPAKAKRPSYDLYIPRGIMKRNWMMKYMRTIPAVVVLFVDLDFGDAHWNEKKIECASKVESMRHSLEGRNTRLAVVLIQTRAPLPPGEDMLAAEHAAELCSSCDLSPKSLFVLPSATDHLYGYIIRLEHAFFELGQTYYSHEIRRVKSKRDYLSTKAGHQPLLVRYQFKLAFLNEMKQDAPSALKHYKQAYVHLLELKVIDAHMLEVKVVAGFINFKICQLCFAVNTPLDAISQFRRHADSYRGLVGVPLLAFEHHAWLAKQFQLFADLFDVAVQKGLGALQTQHPGYYYQTAANHATLRRSVAFELVATLSAADVAPSVESDGAQFPTDPDTAASVPTEFYGSRWWRSSPQQTVTSGVESLNVRQEHSAAVYLLCRECSAAGRVAHSNEIAALLQTAMQQFKRFRCHRMRRLLQVQLGEEYLTTATNPTITSNDANSTATAAQRALQLLSHASWEYRAERWLLPLRVVLDLALRAAYELASIKDFVLISFELLSRAVSPLAADRWRVQTNLQRVFSGLVPADPSQIVRERWTRELAEKCFCHVQAGGIFSPIDVECRFAEAEARVDEHVRLAVRVRSELAYPMQFAKLAVGFNVERYNKVAVLTEKTSDLAFGGASGAGDVVTKEFVFDVLLSEEDAGKNLEVTSAKLDVGHLQSNVYVSISWEYPPSGGVFNTPAEFLTVSSSEETPLRVVGGVARPRVRIVPRDPRVAVEFRCAAPALLHECFPVVVRVRNNEEVPLDGVSLEFLLLDNATNSATDAASMSADPACMHAAASADGSSASAKTTLKIAKSIAVKEESEQTVFVRFIRVATVNLQLLVSCSVGQFRCSKMETLVLSAEEPFEFSARLFTHRMEAIEHLVLDDECLLVAQLRARSKHAILVRSTSWNILPEFSCDGSASTDAAGTDSKSAFELAGTKSASISRRLHSRKTSPHVPLPIGNLLVHWRRSSGPSSSWAETTLALPRVTTEFSPVLVTLEIAAYGVVRTPLNAVYELANRTDSVLDLDVSVDVTDAFMLAGHKQIHVRVLPASAVRLAYAVFPLVAGHVALPRLRLSGASSGTYTSTAATADVLDRCAQRNVPASIFILPQSKCVGEHQKETKTPFALSTSSHAAAAATAVNAALQHAAGAL